MHLAVGTAGLLLSLGLAGSGMDAVPEQAGSIDARRSTATFQVQMRSRTKVAGRLGGVTGDLSGTEAEGYRVRVRIDGRALRMDGPHWMERITRSDSFLAVNRHPMIRFESDLIEPSVLAEGGEVPGELTLRGLTRPVSFLLLPSDCARPGRDCDLQVEGQLSRKAFGMTAYRLLLRDGVDVRLQIRLQPDARP